MATIVAAVGGGNWSEMGTWVGGVVPGAGDDVTITVACTATVTLNGNGVCRSLDCTGFTNTLAQGSGGTLNIGDSGGGSLTLVSGMIYSPNAAAVINFVSTTTGNTVTTGGKSLPITKFNGSGGAWTNSGTMTIAGAATFSAGTFTAGGTVVCSAALTVSGGTLTMTGQTFTGGTTATLSSGTATLTNASFSSSVIISGATVTTGTLSCTSLTASHGSFTPSGNITLSGALSTSISLNLTGYTLSGATNITIPSGGTLTLGANTVITGALSVTGTLAGSGYNITGGTTIACPSGGSITLATFSGTTTSGGIVGTVNVTTMTLSGAWSQNITGATGSVTIGSGGMTCTTFTIGIAGASFTSGSGLINCSSTCTMTGGTVVIGSGGLSATTIVISGSTTRNITLGGTISLSGTGTAWNATTTTGLTFSAGSSTISLTDTSASTKTFAGGTLTYNNISVSGAASNGTVKFSGDFTFNTMTFAANTSILWTASTTFTFSSLVCNGTAGNLVTFASTTNGTAYTQSCANAVSVDYLSVRDSTASGNTPFYAGAHGTLVSGNTNWLLVPATGSTLDPIWFGMTF